MASPFSITTAIDYTNAPPHIGHAYEKILADVLARFHRLIGDDVWFLTGVDQHGQKVQQAAAKEGVAPQEFVDGLTVKFQDLWKRLDLSHDAWAATSDPQHVRVVQEILQALHDRGDIYKAAYKGFYSVRQEQFLTDKERGPDGEFGEEWGEVVELEEENWYFRLSNYREWLLDFIQRTPGLVTPTFRQNELRNAAERLGGDLSISRPKSRLGWGIELPFDRECVTYVWFDALVNYISFAGFRWPQGGSPELPAHWPQLHVIGKDILVPAHGIYWLCMLKAMGFTDDQMPRFLVHGYVMVDGEKMSKSIGNIRDPHTFAERFGVPSLRYYLMRDCAVGQDMDFTDERLVQRFNTDLANNVGNLLNRTLNMAAKYRSGVLKKSATCAFENHAANVEAYRAAMNECRVHQALEIAMAVATSANLLIENEKPWALAKDPAQAERLDAVLYQLAETLRITAILLAPVLPDSAAAILQQLAWNGPVAMTETAWGLLPDGHTLGTPSPLFPRLAQEAAP